MNKKKIIMLVSAVAALVAVTVASLTTVGLAKIDKTASFKMKLRKPDIVDGFFVGFNNWKYFMRNTGSYFYDSPDFDHNGNNAGGEFPRGSNRTIVYAAGLYVGTIKTTGTGVDTQVVSETEFATEFRPGFITNRNVPFRSLTRDDHLAATNKVYFVHKEVDGDKGDWATWPGDHQANGDPALIGSAVTWAVFNDLDTTLSQEGVSASPLPGIGIEVQLQSIAIDEGLLADVVFIRMKIINKTSTNYPKSYVGLWMDPDVNDSSNDIVGIDTLAGLGYTYNATEEVNNAATGFDFFQGPVVDTATIDAGLRAKFAGNNTVLVYNPTNNAFDVTPLPGNQIWLGATSFNTYFNSTDPVDNKERYYLLQGKDKTTGALKVGTGLGYRYAFPGNPLTQQGTASVANLTHAADQRILHGVGPFVINANDSIEMWAGVVGGEGATRLGAFAVMKTTDAYAQTIFNAGLSYPTAPDVPVFTTTAANGKVSLTWDNRVEYSTFDVFGQRAGLFTSNGYTADYLENDFQGYRVYRSRSGLPGSYTMLAEFDKIDTKKSATNVLVDQNGYTAVQEVVFGTDNGLRYSYIDNDVINGQAYYYSVVAYDAQPYIGIVGSPVSMPGGGFAAGPIGMPISLESSVTANVIKVVPQAAVAGSAYDAAVSTVTHTVGTSDGSLDITVVDPKQVRNGTYSLEFFNIPADSQGHALQSDTGVVLEDYQAYRFKLNGTLIAISSQKDNPATYYEVNGTPGYQAGVDVALDDSYFATNQASAADVATQVPVLIDGMNIVVYGPALDFKAFDVTANAGGPLNPAAAGAATFQGFPSSDPDLVNDQQVNGSFWFVNSWRSAATTNGSYDDYVANSVTDWAGWDLLIPNDFEYRFTATGQVGQFRAGTTQAALPFEVWNVSSGTQLLVNWLDDAGTGTFTLTNSDHPASGGTNDPRSPRFYVANPADMSAGSAGYNAWVILNDQIAANYDDVIGRQVFVNWNGGQTTTSGPYNALNPEVGTIFRINTTKPNTNNDVFAFTGTANTVSVAKADVKADMKNIKVVPNPYYGRSDYQQSLFNKQIKFTNLPDVCTIKIFTVAGDLVATLKHNDVSTNNRPNSNPLDLNFDGAPAFTSTEVWNLQNTGGKFVASGMYVALVEAPGKGKKLVKFAVIQEAITINGPDVR